MSQTYLWRSYLHQSDPINRPGGSYKPLNADSNYPEPIWKVACATSAAPRYFKPVTIAGYEHVDGGIHANNPSLETLREIQYQHQGHTPDLFLSIGTGKKQSDRGEDEASSGSERITVKEVKEVADRIRAVRKSTLRSLFELGHHAMNYVVDKEGSGGVNGWLAHCEAMGLQNRYRLNVEGDLFQVRLDEWLPKTTGKKTLDKIKEKTEAYLNQADVQAPITDMANRLVSIRRRRARTERWEAFALDLIYACPHDACPQSRSRYRTRDDLRRHVQNCPPFGSFTAAQREAMLSQGRRGRSNGHVQRVSTLGRQTTGATT